MSSIKTHGNPNTNTTIKKIEKQLYMELGHAKDCPVAHGTGCTCYERFTVKKLMDMIAVVQTQTKAQDFHEDYEPSLHQGQQECRCHCHKDCDGARGGKRIGDAIIACLCYPMDCIHCQPSVQGSEAGKSNTGGGV